MIQPTNAQQIYPQPTGGANAVSINIYNPTAYGSTPQAGTQNAPYNYQNSLYQMPQTSAYQQQVMPSAYQQFMPMQNPMVQQAVVPQQPIVFQPAQAGMTQTLEAPAPQMMPESVMTQPQQPQIVEQQPQPVEQQPQTQAVEQQPQVEATTPQEVPMTINTDELIQQLKDADADKRAAAINQLAAYAQAEPKVALQVVSEPVMNALVDVIKEDTSNLEGPTDKQIAVAEKITKGEKLTPEEEALSEQLSPRDKANKNRIFALYTLAMIQKLQRDELNQYIEMQKANGEKPIAPLTLNDLVGFNEVVNVINNDSRPEVKVAAIQALQYVAEPQDKENVKQILAQSLNSGDEAVKAVAEETMAKVDNTINFETAQAQNADNAIKFEPAQQQANTAA